MMSSVRIPKGVRSNLDEDGNELRRGPWTLEEDNLLIQYISSHGQGQWNSLAKSAGLKRTGKSCRLRWLNYLKPDIKRGNLTPHEQILILELHSRWGNRWSKIAEQLPGRTDNEIKNYWRTRVQKQARQLKVDSNSKKFLEAVRFYWMPRLLEKIEQNSSTSSSAAATSSSPSPSSSSSISTSETPKPAASPPPACSKSDESGAVINSNCSLGIQESCGFLTSFGENENPCYEDMQEMGCVAMSDCHVGDADWFREEMESSFWNSDELWAL